jgi:hypothetical protein
MQPGPLTTAARKINGSYSQLFETATSAQVTNSAPALFQASGSRQRATLTTTFPTSANVSMALSAHPNNLAAVFAGAALGIMAFTSSVPSGLSIFRFSA